MESSHYVEMTGRPHSASISSVHSHGHFIEGLFVESENNPNGEGQSLRPLMETGPDPALGPLAESIENEEEENKPTKDISYTPISHCFIWEGLALVISLVLLITITIVLSQFDGRPQPTWNYVSLNSLISWLSTISKGCVLFATSEALGQLKWVWFTQKTRSLPDLGTFDRATRGFYGSAELIWSLRAKHFAVLGSLAVILALAIDPFTQNLIHYYSNLVTDVSQIATVSTSFVYDVTGLTIHPGAAWYVDPIFKANIYNSLLNNDKTKPWSIPQYTCGTGNCTWDPIAALELSSSCTNVTDQLKFVCYDDKEFISKFGAPNCSVNLLGSTTSASFVLNQSHGYPVSVAYVKSNNALAYKSTNHYTTQMIAPDGLLLEGPFELGRTKWQAMECALMPTVRSFRTSVTNGIYHEETLAIWKNLTPILQGSDYSFNPPWRPNMGIEHNQSFLLSVLSIQAMEGFFKNIFTGRAELTSQYGMIFSSYGGGSYAGTDIIQAISHDNITGCNVNTAEKLGCVMENVAAAASKTFRDSAATDDGPGNGTIVGHAKSSTT